MPESGRSAGGAGARGAASCEVAIVGGFTDYNPDDLFAAETPFLLTCGGELCDIPGAYKALVDPGFSVRREAFEAPPYVCYALKQLLRAHGIDSEMIFYLDTERARLDAIRAAGPRSVFLSTTLLPSKERLRRAAAAVRDLLPDTPIIAGGPFVDRSYRARLRAVDGGDPLYAACSADHLFLDEGPDAALGIDLFVIGDPALEVASRVVRELRAGRDVRTAAERLPNCASVRGGRWEFSAEIRERAPLLTHIDWGAMRPDEIRPTVPVVRSGGCPNRCRFCNFAKVSRPVAKADAEMIAEIAAIAAHHPHARRLYFCDDNICIRKRELEAFLGALTEAATGLKWLSFFDARFVDEALAEALARSGCILLKIGMESADDRILARMRKPCRVVHYRRAVAALSSVGVSVDAYFIVGYPGETEETLRATAENINGFARPSRSANQLIFFPFVLAPFAPIFEAAERERSSVRGHMHEWSHETMDSARAFGAISGLVAGITAMQPMHGNFDKLVFTGDARLAAFDRIRGDLVRRRLAGAALIPADYAPLRSLAAELMVSRNGSFD
jgi:anaerobic magnesium-protoporphyrin IX monomethyl ester cyclase